MRGQPTTHGLAGRSDWHKIQLQEDWTQYTNVHVGLLLLGLCVRDPQLSILKDSEIYLAAQGRSVDLKPSLTSGLYFS